MSKALKITLFLTVIVVIASGYIYYLKQQERHEYVRQSSEFVQDMLKAISARWNPEELKSRAHPLLLEAVNKSSMGFNDYFAQLQRLGALQNGNCNMLALQTLPEATHEVAVEYACAMKYQNSSANIHIVVRQNSAKHAWQVVVFNVDSPLFAKKTANEAPKDTPKEEPKETPKETPAESSKE